MTTLTVPVQHEAFVRKAMFAEGLAEGRVRCYLVGLPNTKGPGDIARSLCGICKGPASLSLAPFGVGAISSPSCSGPLLCLSRPVYRW